MANLGQAVAAGRVNGGSPLARFRMLPFGEKALFALAFPIVVIAAGLLRVAAFARIAPLLGRQVGAIAWMPLLDNRQKARANEIRRAVLRAARLSPFRSDCLPQAVTGAVLCRLFVVPAAVHLGVRKAGAKLEAHAWLCAGGVAITGGHSFTGYTVVSCFALGVEDR